MPHLVTVAAVSLCQQVLAFEENKNRIVKSIVLAKAAGASVRVGSELEVSGYGCLDHFHEQDVFLHSLEVIRDILLDERCRGIIIDLGAPIAHRNVKYNCRVLILDGKILLIRPKMHLANDGNYREHRYFTPWMKPCYTEQYQLPRFIAEIVGSTHTCIGDAVISTPDTCLGAETCEELFTVKAPHIDMSLDGVEIFTNSSGSHFTLQKLDQRLQLIMEATRKCGGVYIYSNQQGCDGERVYYDGSAMIILNGQIVAQGSQFSLNEVEVVTATVDLDEVRAHRSAPSRGLQAAVSNMKYERIQTTFELGTEDDDLDITKRPSLPIKPRLHSVEEEITLCTGCYLWDYLRRSGTAGYILPLSGGIDSCATAVIVFSMCRIVIQAMEEGNQQVIEDVKRIAKYSDELPKTPQALCNQIFTTIYMGMKKQSSSETRGRAKELAAAIGSHHIDMDIDEAYEAQKKFVVDAIGFDPKFRVEGGTDQENLTLQCLQARIRMVTTYEFGQILPTARGRPGGGSLLVLGSANVGESLVGYLTKYDCSSADINVLGSIDKADLKQMIAWAAKPENFDLPCLNGFLSAVPTAELEPITDDYVQSDEQDMGLTYQELTIFGRLRKVNKLGPYGMFQRLVHDWSAERVRTPEDDAPSYTPEEIAAKTKRFFSKHYISRHKMTTITPAVHCNDYSPDDNRFDLRPFLYPSAWKSWGFKKIDRELEKIKRRAASS